MVFLPSPILIVMALESEGGDAFRGKSVSVLYTGVGKVNAAYSLSRRLAAYVSAGEVLPLVLNFGTAGSRCFARGSVVACSEFVQRDMDATPLGVERGTTPFDALPSRLSFSRIFTTLPHGVCGTADSFTTDYDVATCNVVDMEGFALAKVCRFFGADFAAIKFITDGADSASGAEWQDNVHKAWRSFEQIYIELVGAAGGVMR